MKYCQGPKCHRYMTKDRIRGPKGDKHYQTRKQTHYFVNDLLGERIPITDEQYQDENFTTPN